MTNFNRVEVIYSGVRVFSRYYDEPMSVSAAVQDGGSTVKIFVDRAEDLGYTVENTHST